MPVGKKSVVCMHPSCDKKGQVQSVGARQVTCYSCGTPLPKKPAP